MFKWADVATTGAQLLSAFIKISTKNQHGKPLISLNNPSVYITVYLLTLLLVAISNSFNVVVARSQQCMEVAPLCSKDSHSPIQYNDCPNNRLSTLVPHYTTHPFVDLDWVEMEGKLRLCGDGKNTNLK